jgi:hypothetical protein
MQKAFSITSGSTAVSVVADGVVAMWIRCFDFAGNPIPWLNQSSFYPSTAPIQFNSAASFQMAPPDGAFTPENGAVSSGTASFQYSMPGSTVEANRLPASVEITIVVVDSRALSRNPVLPDMPPPPSDPKDVPAQIEQFNADLLRAGVRSARTLTTRVKLLNACP